MPDVTSTALTPDVPLAAACVGRLQPTLSLRRFALALAATVALLGAQSVAWRHAAAHAVRSERSAMAGVSAVADAARADAPGPAVVEGATTDHETGPVCRLIDHLLGAGAAATAGTGGTASLAQAPAPMPRRVGQRIAAVVPPFQGRGPPRA